MVKGKTHSTSRTKYKFWKKTQITILFQLTSSTQIMAINNTWNSMACINRPVPQMRAPLSARREPAGSYSRLLKVLAICFVIWICYNTPILCGNICEILLYNRQLVVTTYEPIYVVQFAHLYIRLEGPEDPHLRNSIFSGHVTALTLQCLWPRPPLVWLGGPGCKPGHSG